MIVALFLVNTVVGTKESKSKSGSLMISMPVKKFDIVKSRYLAMIIYIFGILGIMYLISNIGKVLFNNMSGSPLGLVGIFIISSIIIILLSFYLPFQYYNLKSAQFFSAILYLLVINIPNIIKRFNISIDNFSFIEKVLSLNFEIAGLILFVVCLVLYLISSFVSKGIYETKEF